MKCTFKGRPGYRWGGKSNKCYLYTPGDKQSRANAIKRAMKQAVAIGKGKVPKE